MLEIKLDKKGKPKVTGKAKATIGHEKPPNLDTTEQSVGWFNKLLKDKNWSDRQKYKPESPPKGYHYEYKEDNPPGKKIVTVPNKRS